MATVYYVDPSRELSPAQAEPDGLGWDDPFTTLQDACDVATSGDTILVKAGRTIVPTASDPIDIPAGVTVYGGYPRYDDHNMPDMDDGDEGERALWEHPSVIDALGECPCLNSVGSSATVDGFVFKNGYSSGASGGGLTMSSKTNVTFENCVWTHCEAGSNGGAVYLSGSTGAEFIECQFGLCEAYTDGGAIYIDGTSGATFTNCRFVGNTAGDDGGAIDNENDLLLINCVGTHNEATDDGGFLFENGNSTTVESCTICANVAGGDGGGIESQSAVTLVNSIVRENNATGSGDQWNGSVTQTYSNVDGGATGSNGNIDDDPLFREYGPDPYEPIAASGNCDSADTSTTNWPSLDILGRGRYDDPDTANTGVASDNAYTDMGAYEYRGIESDYMDYASFKMQLGGNVTSASYGEWHMYAILVATPQPPWWATDTEETGACRYEVGTEMYIHETDSVMRDICEIGGVRAIGRDAFSVSPAHTGPTWEEEMHENAQASPSTPYYAVQHDYPAVLECSMYGNAQRGHKPLFTIADMRWDFTIDDSADVLDVYNMWLNPIMDNEDARDDLTFKSALHNGSTVTDTYEADMPISSYLVKEVLGESLMCMLYEARNPMTLPLYGKYAPIVIVV